MALGNDVDTPTVVINFSIFAGKRNNKHLSEGAPAHVMTRHPGLQTIIRFDLGSLTTTKAVDAEDDEWRMQRIARHSSVLTGARDEYGNMVSTRESLGKADGELRLHVPGGGNQFVFKYSEILGAMCTAGEFAPLGGGGVPPVIIMAPLCSPPSSPFRPSLAMVSPASEPTSLDCLASVTRPLLPIRQHWVAIRVLVFRRCLHVANRTTAAAFAPWRRMLARLPHKW